MAENPFLSLEKQLRYDQMIADEYICINPEIQGGQAVIVGTRLTVAAVRARISNGDDLESLADDYPYVPDKVWQQAMEAWGPARG